MIQVEAIFDYRLQTIRVGDTVGYADDPVLKAIPGASALSIQAAPSVLRHSVVKSIVGADFPGFCEMGRQITITLLDGHVETGDSENGGWNLLKLSEDA